LTNETFGQRLKRLRQERQLRSKDLAERLGITLPYLSQMEADLAVPSEDLAKTIAKVLGQNEEEIVFLARRVPRQIDDILQKFPNTAPPYFRRKRE
jgi:HTH-type transcriptional regulator, competence development regulator